MLQFIGVEPQTVTAGALIERQRLSSFMFYLNLVQGGIAARAEVRATTGLNAGLLLEFQEGIACVCAGLLHERFEFAGIEPEAVTVVAEIDFDILEVEDKQRDIAFWANTDHSGASLCDDGASAVEASSTSRVRPLFGFCTFI